ncbi:unnamed protein product, partial [Meganyctiphanes norvegica]
VIRHPLSGDEYKINENCTWIIRAAEVDTITISFDSFRTEYVYDVLTIRDGDSNEDVVIGKFSGGTVPPSVKTSNNSAHLFFKSDESKPRTGFELRWGHPNMLHRHDGGTAHPCGVPA